MTRNTFVYVLLGLVSAGLFAAGGYWYAMHRMNAQPAMETSAKPPLTAAGGKSVPATERRVLYWHDPMSPGSKFDKPGKSPFMDMQLVPVYADEVATEGGVTINPRTLQNLGIRIAEVKEGRVETGLSTTGAVVVDERTLIAVQARVNGIIEKLYVRAQYDTVARGQALVDIYSPEWLAAQEEYLVLKRSTQPDAQSLAQAARQRLSLLGISEPQIQRIEQSGQSVRRITLYAPEGGVVWELGVRDGMAVNPGLTLFRLAGLGSVWVNAEVPEADAALVKPGAPVEARSVSFPDTVYKGTVATLLPDVSPTTRTIKARIVLANPGGRLKPGMFVKVDFGAGAGAMSALMAPSEAVIHTGKRAVVIVAEEGGKFRPVEIETGRDSGDLTEIRKGLVAGQKVVSSGQFLIDSESSLKTTLNRLESARDRASDTTGSAAKSTQLTGSGKVNQIDSKEGTVEISHGPIPALKWPAMTMVFRTADKSLLTSIKPGDEIEFELRGEADKAGDYVITRITPRKPAAK